MHDALASQEVDAQVSSDQETSTPIRSLDRRQRLAVEHQSQGGAPEAKRGRTTLTVIFARRQEARREGTIPQLRRRDHQGCVMAGTAWRRARAAAPCGELSPPTPAACGGAPSSVQLPPWADPRAHPRSMAGLGPRHQLVHQLVARKGRPREDACVPISRRLGTQGSAGTAAQT
jgi:hypothetical protein